MKKREHSAKSKITDTRLQNFKSNKERLKNVNNVTVEEFESKSTAYSDRMAEYNELVKKVEEKSKEMDAAEKVYNQYGSKFLTGVASAYGPDSEEYRAAGGTPLSERNTGKPKKTAVAAVAKTVTK